MNTNKSNNNHIMSARGIYLLSFFIPLVMILAIYAARYIFPFGGESFLHMDLYHQYLPFLTEFNRIVKEGGSLLYSWQAGLGNNFITLLAYYLATPSNWLSLVVSQDFLIEYLTYLTAIKIALSSLSFAHYLRKHGNSNNMGIVLFSIAYSMSAWWAAYSWNVMWVDCLIMLPLIILGLERLVNEGRMSLYIISLGFCIFTNFYISIMVCLFVVLYFIVLMFSANKRLLAIGRFSVASLISGGIASVLLLPCVTYMFGTEYAGNSFPRTLSAYFNMFEAFARHLMNVQIEEGLDHWPNIYCGVAILILLFLYMFSGKISLKQRIPKLVLVSIMLFSFCYNIPNFIWHGLNYPNSLPARQSFLYIFLLLSMGYEAFIHIKDTKWPWVIISGLLGAGIVILAYIFVKDDAFTIWSFTGSAICVVIYFIVMLIYKGVKSTRQVATFFVTLCFVVTEFVTNMLMTGVYTVTRSYYVAEQKDFSELSNYIKNTDSDFYRTDKLSHRTQNDSMLSDFNSASLFSSVSNALVHEFYDRYGLRNSKVFYSFEGASPLTAALLNIKYVMGYEDKAGNDLFSQVGSYSEAILYKNKYYLPMGFILPDTATITSDMKQKELLKDSERLTRLAGNVFVAQNQLARELGAEEDIFTRFDTVNTSATSVIEVPSDGNIYAYVSNGGVSKIKAIAEGQTKEFSGCTDNYILDLGYHKAGSIITLSTEDTESSLNTTAAILNEKSLGEVISKLSKESFQVTSMKGSSLTGNISSSRLGHVYLSVPYDDNWIVKVDGEIVQASAYQDAFLAIPVSSGTHTIEINYSNKLVVVGGILSAVFVLIWVTIALYERRSLPSVPGDRPLC